MDGKRLSGNQFALLATCNEPDDDDSYNEPDNDDSYRKWDNKLQNSDQYNPPPPPLKGPYNQEEETEEEIEAYIQYLSENDQLIRPPPTQHQYQRPPPPPQYQASPPRSSYHPGYYLHPKGYMVSKNYRGKNPKPRQYIHRSNNSPRNYHHQPPPPHPTFHYQPPGLDQPFQECQAYKAYQQQHETYPPQKPFPTYYY